MDQIAGSIGQAGAETEDLVRRFGSVQVEAGRIVIERFAERLVFCFIAEPGGIASQNLLHHGRIPYLIVMMDGS